MAQRVAVFIDYQNVYMRARDAFHHGSTWHVDGQVRPAAVGLCLRGEREGDRTLTAVHVYRGMPIKNRDERGFEAAQRQIAGWVATGGGLVHPHTRPLNYRDPERPREKGVDVMLAVDFVLGFQRGEFDVGIIFSDDTDLHPALEAVGTMGGPGHCELATWRDASRTNVRVVKSGGQTAYTRVLAREEYTRVRDHQDYNQRSARKPRPPRRT